MDWRRWALAVISVGLGAASGYLYASGVQGQAAFWAGGLGRVAILGGVMVLAWPSLRRPAAWLPAGAPLLVLIMFALVAVRPRLFLFLLPIVGAVITYRWVLKAIFGR